jgi:16S rRNA (uracil1498-N3)-methyltransferase
VTGPSEGWVADEEAVAHVFVDDLGETCEITGDDGHHLQRARRIARGEVVTAADGTGLWRAYEVADAARGRVQLVARAPVRREPELRPLVGLAVALTKGGIDTAVARATELGVARVTPLVTQRTIVRWNEAKAAAAVDRLRGIAREAAAQSRRARVPPVDEPATVAELAGRAGLVVADRGGVSAADLAIPAIGTWNVAVGPEGGFAPEELEQLAHAPRLRLGPHVLRAETAPVAAVAVLMARIAFPALRPDSDAS